MTGRREPEKDGVPTNSPARDGGRRKVPAVFLDRDGTINEEVGYLGHVNHLRLLPGAIEAIQKLNQAQLPVIVVTNQAGVARGFFSEEVVREVHEQIARQLAEGSARIDAFYYCPHHPEGFMAAYRKECDCRKPATGMVDEAARRFNIDLSSSYVIGDTYRDMQLGFNAGMRTILVLTGYGRGELENKSSGWERKPDHVREDLLEAVETILENSDRASAGPSDFGSASHRQ